MTRIQRAPAGSLEAALYRFRSPPNASAQRRRPGSRWDRRRWLGLIALCLALGSTASAAPPPPNFVVILADDLGWTDLSCMGSTFYETPHMDRLASQGMRFTQAYSACTVCSPTRAALLTGLYPARLHLTDWIAGHVRPEAKLRVPDWTMHLSLDTTTLAEALHTRGYATAHIGKWHLGPTNYWPQYHGFDRTLAGSDRGQPPSYFSPYKIPTLADGPPGEYLTDRETTEAIHFMRNHTHRPFFLYLPYHAVHTPLQAPEPLVKKYEAKADPKARQRHPVYAAMIENLDHNIGRLLACLEELKLTDRSVVIFTSDNGGLTLGRPTPTTDNTPLRAGKGSSYEGGVRVPLLIQWPSQIQAGSQCAHPVMTTDLYPTLLELAGGSTTPPGGPMPDGQSLVPLLRGAPALSRQSLFWHYPHYHPGGATPYSAIRDGDLKLIHFYEEDRVELYNLADDIGETKDLANQQPGKALQLREKLNRWRQEVGAQAPIPNPAFDAARPPLPEFVIRPASDGTVVLHAKDVTIHGSTVRYEPQPHKNTVGYWTRVEDWVGWDFAVTRPGRYKVELLQGCGPGNGGSDVRIEIGSQSLAYRVLETRGFQDFVLREAGVVTLREAGRHRLAVRPQRKAHQAIMDLRQITLRPLPGP